MKLKLWLVTVATFVLLAIALAYGIYARCGYCGPTFAVLSGLAVAIFPVLWGLTQGLRSKQVSVTQCCGSDHEYSWEDDEEVMPWYADIPVWCKVKVKRCRKCDHEEAKDLQALW